jgi:hypothetical protein
MTRIDVIAQRDLTERLALVRGYCVVARGSRWLDYELPVEEEAA